MIFGDATISVAYSILNATIISYQDQEIRYGEGLLQLNQSRLPFDISLESLTPFEQTEIGYKYSFAGMRIHLARNNCNT